MSAPNPPNWFRRDLPARVQGAAGERGRAALRLRAHTHRPRAQALLLPRTDRDRKEAVSKVLQCALVGSLLLVNLR